MQFSAAKKTQVLSSGRKYFTYQVRLQRVIFQYPNILPQMTSFNQEMMELQPEIATSWL